MSIPRTRTALVRGGFALAAFVAAAGVSAGSGAPPDDPLLRYSSYLIASGIDEAKLCAFAPDGTLWIAGTVSSAKPDRDVVVVRFHPPSRRIVSMARIGGGHDEDVVALAVDAAGNVYIAGNTASPDFPVTGGILEAWPNVAQSFVARLLPDGQGFAWSFAFGGLNAPDLAAAMCLTAGGDPVVVGTTYSVGFPLVSPLHGSYGGGDSDAFVTRLAADGSGIVFSTFLGGSNGDQASSVCLAPDGAIVVAGSTESANFLATASRIAGVPLVAGQGPERFLAEIDAAGTELRRLAGLGATEIGRVAAAQDSLVVCGRATDGLPFPAPQDGLTHEFLLRLGTSASAWTPLGGVFLGASNLGHVASIAVGPDGTVWTAGGMQDSADLPIPGAARPHLASPRDVYVGAYEPAAFTQVFGTYLGGSDDDEATAVAVATDGGAWIVGRTQSGDFPTVGAPAPGLSPGDSAPFLANLSAGDPALRPAAVAAFDANAVDGHSIRVSWTPGDAAATAFAIDRSELSPQSVGWTRVALAAADAREWIDTAVRPDRTYRYSVQAVDAAGGSPASAPMVATTPATLGFSIRDGIAKYSSRPSRQRHPGEVLRLRGKLVRSDGGAPTLDLTKDGVALIGGDIDTGQLLFFVGAGDPLWRTGRSGVQRRKSGTSRIVFNPATGSFDLRSVRSRWDVELERLTDARFGRTALRVRVGGEFGSVVPDWFPVLRPRARPQDGDEPIGARIR